MLDPVLAQAVLMQAPCGLLLVVDQRIVFVNQHLHELLGLPALEPAAPLSPESLFTAHSSRHFEELCAQALEQGAGRTTSALVARRGDGSLLEMDAQINTVRVGEEITLAVMLHASCERFDAARSLSRLAFHDSLTGLPNRALFLDRLNQSLRWCKRHRSGFALLSVDLDGFKAINDTHGHDMGDAVLREVADLLRNIVRESDTVARLGGDEFAILMHDVDGCNAALNVAEHIHQAFSPGLRLADLSLPLGASVGIAAWPEHGADMHSLMVAADAAMYDAKRQRKGTSRYSHALRAERRGLSSLMLGWSSDLECGVPQIDDEHRNLLDSVNQLVAAFSSAEDLVVVQARLNTFIHLAAEHFGHEEDNFMHVLSEQDKADHQQEHRHALAELKRLYAAVEVSGVSQTIQFVSDWLFEHIRHNDRSLCRALLAADAA